MCANMKVQHATYVHNSLARTSHTRDAWPTPNHKGKGKCSPKMRLDGEEPEIVSEPQG